MLISFCGDQKIPALRQRPTVPGRAHPAQTGSLASERVQAKAVNHRSVQVFGEQEDRIEQDQVHAGHRMVTGDCQLFCRYGQKEMLRKLIRKTGLTKFGFLLHQKNLLTSDVSVA